MLIKPAVAPVADANGMVNVIEGVVVEFATVDVNVFPLALTVIGFILVTVPIPPVPPTTSNLIVPFPLVIATPFPAVNVAFDKVFPLLFPINN